MRNKSAGLFIALCLFVMALILGLISCRRDVRVQVVGHVGEYRLAVLRYGLARHGNWCNLMPVGALNATYEMRLHHYDNQYVGATCIGGAARGDGTCLQQYERSAVYQAWCTWESYGWQQGRTLLTTSENPFVTPLLPTPDFTPCFGIGCERRGSRTVRLYVVYHSPETGDQVCPASSVQEWTSRGVGDEFTAVYTPLTRTLDCRTLRRGDKQ